MENSGLFYPLERHTRAGGELLEGIVILSNVWMR